jgi:hypothetical protein
VKPVLVLFWSALASTGCVKLIAPDSTEGGRMYEVSEGRAQELVFQALLKEHVVLFRTEDPHVLRSKRISQDTSIPDGEGGDKVLLTDVRQWTVVFKPMGPKATMVFVRRGSLMNDAVSLDESNLGKSFAANVENRIAKSATESVGSAPKNSGKSALALAEANFDRRVVPVGLRDTGFMKLTRDLKDGPGGPRR